MSADTTAATLCAAFARGLRPRDKLTVSEWADRYRILPAKGAAEPGPWRTSRTPYLREPMDCLSAHDPAEVVVLMFASQTGKSEALNNFLGYVVDHAPGPMLLIQPTVEAAEQYSRQRIAPMCELPPLSGKIRDPRDRDGGNTVLSKEYPGGTLILRGANSATGLSSMPIQYACFDEVDRYPAEIDDDGDPVTVGSQRTATFASGRKIAITSTPTVKGTSRVDAEYLDTDQRRYYVPCPHCGHLQVLKLTATPEDPGGLEWPANDPGAAQYRCAAKACARLIDAAHRDGMVALGVWRATAPARNRRVGFQLSALYSPWRSWGELATMFLAAKASAKREGPARLRAFVNLQLGEAWDPGNVAAVEARGIERRAERGWGAGQAVEVPAGAAVLTAGVDVQPTRGCIVVEVVAWGAGYESWSVDWIRIDGDPTAPPPRPGQPKATGVWAELDAVLARTYRHETVGDMPIRAACVDTGAQSQNVYAYVKPRQKRRVWGIKGQADSGGPIWPDRVSTNNRGGIDLRRVNVDQAKEDIYWRLSIREPGPGYSHFPAGRDSSYFEELTAETVKTVRRYGRSAKRWELRDGQRNEALDCRVYAYAAAIGLVRQRKVTLEAPPRPAKPRPAPPPEVAEQVREPLGYDEDGVVDTSGVRPDAAPARRAAPPGRRRQPRRGGWWADLADW